MAVQTSPQKPAISLVLASGGARGVAHIGVIQALEEQGFQIAEVVGCSMGAVVGGLYASGHLPEYRKWLCGLQRSDILKLLDFTLTKNGLLKGEKIFSTILGMTGEQMIEDLDIPFTAVATDLYTGEEVLFRKGDLFEALRATVSIPGIFTPAQVGGRVLIDGGVINPLPLNHIKPRKNHLIVAVDINAPDPPEIKKTQRQSPKNWLSIPWPWSKPGSHENPVPDHNLQAKPEGGFNNSAFAQPEMNLVDALQTSYSHMQNRLIRLTTECYPHDAYIKIPRSTCGIFEFFRAQELIDIGYEKMQEQMASNPHFKEFST